MRLQFIGCGDAFGSGGRLNACFHVTGDRVNFLLECGASSLPGLKFAGIDLNRIELILTTHFHADHFGGIPFFIQDAQLVSKRTAPLTIAGPPGLTVQYERVMEAAFSGSSRSKRRFPLTLVELKAHEAHPLGALTVASFPASHGRPAGSAFSYRIEVEARTIAYTGDTEWTDALVQVGMNADLFIAEAYFFDKEVKNHLNLATLQEHLPAIQPKRLVLTHMSADMIARLSEVPYEAAEDGKIVQI